MAPPQRRCRSLPPTLPLLVCCSGLPTLRSKDKRVLLLGWVLVLAVRVEAQCCLEPEHLQARLPPRPLRSAGDHAVPQHALLCCAQHAQPCLF